MAEDSEEDVWFDLVSVQMAVWWIIEVIHHTHKWPYARSVKDILLDG